VVPPFTVSGPSHVPSSASVPVAYHQRQALWPPPLDVQWVGYWSNVIVPPHLASLPNVVDHFKRKFYHEYTMSLIKLPVLLVVVIP
jgi:hypothetical protein